jgi:hypothetical protein
VLNSRFDVINLHEAAWASHVADFSHEWLVLRSHNSDALIPNATSESVDDFSVRRTTRIIWSQGQVADALRPRDYDHIKPAIMFPISPARSPRRYRTDVKQYCDIQVVVS